MFHVCGIEKNDLIWLWHALNRKGSTYLAKSATCHPPSRHTTPKHGGIHRGRSPYEIWGERSASGRKPLSPEHIRTALFKPEAVRTVGRGPSVKLGDDYYYCDKLAWGSRVLVKTDTLDRGHVLCCTLDGALIGEAKTRAAIRAIDGDRTEIAALMRRQRRQLLEARTAVADLTGGKSICSPVELLLAGPDAEAVRLPDSISSVKGSAHHYVHHRLIGGIEPAAQIEFREEEKEKRLAEFGSVAAPHQQEEPASSREALSSFNDFMTSRRNGDDGF